MYQTCSFLQDTCLTIDITTIAILSLITRVSVLSILYRSNPSLFSRVAPRARPSLMLFRLLIIHKRLAMLVISSWLITCDLDDCEITVAFAENAIHFFKRAVCSLWVEEVYDRNHEGVAVECRFSKYFRWTGERDLHDGEDDIGLVLD